MCRSHLRMVPAPGLPGVPTHREGAGPAGALLCPVSVLSQACPQLVRGRCRPNPPWPSASELAAVSAKEGGAWAVDIPDEVIGPVQNAWLR